MMFSNSSISRDGWRNQKFFMSDVISTDQLPETGVRYWVQCEHFGCLAVVDKNGKWKSFSNGKELPVVINFFAHPLNQPVL
jgi:hypothetical protein